MSRSSLYKKIVLSFRPKTLTAALVPCLAGSALSMTIVGKYDSAVLFYALLASFCIQIGTNLVNDAVDFKKGADKKDRIGPERITSSGILSYKQVMLLAGFFFLLSILAGVPLVVKGGLPIIILGLVSVLMGYSYTAGPFPLAYLGLGDLFVVLFFGLIAVGGIYFLNTGTVGLPAILLGLQVGFHAAVLIAINNLRDMHGDKLVNKKTLAVRLGKKMSRYEILILCLLPFVLGLYWITIAKPWAFLLPLLSLPLAVKIIRNIFNTEPSKEYNQFLGQSAGLHLFFGLLTAVGMLL